MTVRISDNARILAIIPAFNEAEAIGQVLADIPDGLVAEVVVVNNGSSDATEQRARAAGATVVSEERRGYGWACLRGMAYARTQDPDILVFLDGDYSDYPEEMPSLVDPVLKGRADLVIGSRMRGAREARALPPQSFWGNWLAGRIMQWRWGAPFTDLGPFRAVRFDRLLELEMQEKTYGWTAEMQIKALRAGFRCAEVPVSYRRRIGVSKITGTISGTVKASARILWILARYAFRG